MIDKSKQRRNCRYLAKKLRTITKKNYDQNVYYEHRGKHEQKVPDVFDCKTKACSWGHAACMPYFNKQGLYMKLFKATDIDPKGFGPNMFHSSKKGRAMFGLSLQDSFAIFGDRWEVGSRYSPCKIADKLEAHAKTL